MQGEVKWFHPTKGYGFIVPDDGSAEVFVHGNNVVDGELLMKDDRVEFQPVHDQQGRTKAGQVRKIR